MGADRKLANWDKLHEYYQHARQDLRPTHGWSSWARRARAVPTSRSSSRRRPTWPGSIELRAARTRGSPTRAGCPRPRPSKLIADAQGGDHPDLRAALERGGRGADRRRVRLRQRDPQRRGSARAMLDNVISIVVPSINPDGTQMIADWYMKYVGTAYEAAGLPWLYQKYAGHDNNRDGFALNLPESQHLAQADVSRVAAAGLRRSPPDGQRQRAALHSAVRRADPSRRRSAGVARDGVVGRAHGQPARSGGQDRRDRRRHLLRLGPHGLPLDHARSTTSPACSPSRRARGWRRRCSCIPISCAAARATCPSTRRRPTCRASGPAAGGACATSSSSRRSPRGRPSIWRRATARRCCGTCT